MKSSLGGASIREQIHKFCDKYTDPSESLYDKYPYVMSAEAELLTLIESITKEVLGEKKKRPEPKDYTIDKNNPMTLKENEYRAAVNYTNGNNDTIAEQLERLAQLLGEKK